MIELNAARSALEHDLAFAGVVFEASNAGNAGNGIIERDEGFFDGHAEQTGQFIDRLDRWSSIELGIVSGPSR